MRVHRPGVLNGAVESRARGQRAKQDEQQPGVAFPSQNDARRTDEHERYGEINRQTARFLGKREINRRARAVSNGDVDQRPGRRGQGFAPSRKRRMDAIEKRR